MAVALTQEQKTFVVQQLAMYRTPTEVAELVKETFDGLEISRNLAAAYNPERRSDVAQVWRDIFYATREKFLKDVAAIPISHQAVRLQALQKLLDNQMNNGNRINTAMVMKILEQAAKEAGGLFTNRREVTGKDGEPLVITTEDLARKMFKDLQEQEGFTREDSLTFVLERYKVDETVLVSEASN